MASRLVFFHAHILIHYVPCNRYLLGRIKIQVNLRKARTIRKVTSVFFL